MSKHVLSVAILAFASIVTSPCLAETLTFHAELKPASEVPPVNAPGSGTAQATLDTVTHVLGYDLTFAGFTSPVTMAHFHGPAAAGVNAGVVVPLGNMPTSPLHGTVTLTPAQQGELVAGQWYANLHTAANPKGAARGQMMQIKQ